MHSLHGLLISVVLVGLSRLKVVHQHAAHLVHRVELRHVSSLVLLRVHLLTQLIDLDSLEALLSHVDVSLVRLGRLAQIEALLPRFLILEHLILHDGFHDVVSLVVVVDDFLHIAAVSLAPRSRGVRVLLRGYAVRAPLQLSFQLRQVHARTSHTAATPPRLSLDGSRAANAIIHLLISNRVKSVMFGRVHLISTGQVLHIGHKSV